MSSSSRGILAPLLPMMPGDDYQLPIIRANQIKSSNESVSGEMEVNTEMRVLMKPYRISPGTGDGVAIS